MDTLIRTFCTPGVPFTALIVFLEQIGLPVPATPAPIVAGALREIAEEPKRVAPSGATFE